MSCSQVFTKIFHFSENSRHHASKANHELAYRDLIGMLLGEGPVSIPFSVSLKLQFADDLDHFIGAETITYSQKNRLVKHLAKH